MKLKTDEWYLVDPQKIPSDFLVGPYKFKVQLDEDEFSDETIWENKRYLILKGAEEGESWYFCRYEKKEKIYLTQEEFNYIIPLLIYWNSFKDKGYKITIHKLPQTIQNDVTITLKNTAKIVADIYKYNFVELSNIFLIFKNKRLSEDYFKKLILLYIQKYMYQNKKEKLNFYSFVYNPMADFSWMCHLATSENVKCNNEIELPSNSLLIYQRLIGQKNSLTELDNIELKKAVSELYIEYQKIKYSVGWFHRTIKPKYLFNDWKFFCQAHVDSLLENYNESNLLMIKPINKDGDFTKAYEKFIGFVKDKYAVSLYLNTKAFDVLLRNRYLIQYRENPELFCEDATCRFLYKREKEALDMGKIKLIDGIKIG